MDERPYPKIVQVVLDCTNARELAEFYRELFGLLYRPGDEPAADGTPDKPELDWLVLTDENGARQLTFQQIDELLPATWPDGTLTASSGASRRSTAAG